MRYRDPNRPISQKTVDSYPSRFWSHVHKDDDGCWYWLGMLSTNGYGKFSPNHRRTDYAHRLSWELTQGPIPTGMLVCHTCDNKLCVNPEHLWLGTNMENKRDSMLKGRHNWNWVQGSASSGAKLTEESVAAIVALLGTTTQKEIARRFGVSQATISSIAVGRTWTHVKEDSK